MSRIRKLPIALPQGVELTVSPENVVTVKGPKGSLTQEVDKDIIVKVEEGQIIVGELFFQTLVRSHFLLTRILTDHFWRCLCQTTFLTPEELFLLILEFLWFSVYVAALRFSILLSCVFPFIWSTTLGK